MASPDDKFSRDDVSMARQFDQVMARIAAKSKRFASDMAKNKSIYDQIKETLTTIDSEMRDFRSEALKFSAVQKGILNQMQFAEALARKNDTSLLEQNALTQQLLSVDEDILRTQISISEITDSLIGQAKNHHEELTESAKILNVVNNVEESILGMLTGQVKQSALQYIQLTDQFTSLQDIGKELKKQHDLNKKDPDISDKLTKNLTEQQRLQKEISKITASVSSDAELKTNFDIATSLIQTNNQRRTQLELMKLQEHRNKEIAERQDTINEIFGTQLGTVRKIGGELSHIAHSPLGAILVVANGIHEVFGEWIEGISETREELGLSYNQAIQFGALTTHNLKSYLLFGNKTTEMIGHMTEHLGHMPHFTSDSVKEMTKFAAINNIAVSEAATLAANLYEIPGMTEQMTQNGLKYAQALGEANHIPIGQLTKTIASNTEDFALFANKGAKNVLEAATFAKKLGVEFSTITNTAKQLLDFESSVTKQVETSALLGREVNFDRARQLALSNDLVGMQKEIIKQLGSESEWNRLNIIQRQSIAESLGMSVLETEKLIKNQKYGQEGLEAQAKAAEKLNDIMMYVSRIFSSTTFEIALAGIGLVSLIARYNKLKEFGSGVISDFKDGFKSLGKDIAHILSMPFKLLSKPFKIPAPDFSKFKLPSFKLPSVDLSKFKLPKFSLPKLKWPPVPSLKIQPVNWTKILGIDKAQMLLSKISMPKFNISSINWKQIIGAEKATTLFNNIKIAASKFFDNTNSKSRETNSSLNVLSKTLTNLKSKFLDLVANEKVKNFFSKILPKKKLVEPNIQLPTVKEQVPRKSIGERISSSIGKINMTDMVKGAAALTLIAGALFITGKALHEFENIGWDSIGKGLVTLTGLGVIASFLQKASKELIIGAIGIGAMGLALIPFASAMATFTGVDWKTVGVATTSLLAFSAATIALGAIMSSGAGALVFGAGVLAIAALGGAMIVFGEGMQSTASGIQKLSANIKPLSENIKSLTSNVDELFILAAGLTAVGAGLTALGIGGIASLPGIMALTALAKLATVTGLAPTVQQSTKPMVEEKTERSSESSLDMTQLLAKIDELIVLFKQPGVVNLDGRKVGEALRLATPSSSGR